MYDSGKLGLYPLLEDSVAGRFDLDRAVGLLRAAVGRVIADFDLDTALVLRRYLDLARLDSGGAAEIAEIADLLRRGLEDRLARDPSDYNALHVLALDDLERGETGLARRRLRKVAASGYRARARAEAALARLDAAQGTEARA